MNRFLCACRIVVLLILQKPIMALALDAHGYFKELKDAGGINPAAQLVCYPATGDEKDTTFTVVMLSNHVAATLRRKGLPVAKEVEEAENAQEKDKLLIQWMFRNGVRLQKDPEILEPIIGSQGAMWSTEYNPPEVPKSTKLTLRMVFSVAGRYSRDVLVNGVITHSTYGQCEPIP